VRVVVVVVVAVIVAVARCVVVVVVVVAHGSPHRLRNRTTPALARRSIHALTSASGTGA
jgi:hypothetical protein